MCRRESMDTPTIDESDIGPNLILNQQAPPNDGIEVHHTADMDTEQQLQFSQQWTDIDVQNQLQNWNFHTVNKL